MNTYKSRLIMLATLLMFSGRCVTNSYQTPEELTLNKQINELLDKIETNPSHITLGSFSVSSRIEDHWEGIAKNCRLLIENPDISLPMIFKRLDAKKTVSYESWSIYFIIFGKTKSVDSIPYIISYVDNSETQHDLFPGPVRWSIQQITSLDIVDDYRPLFDQRKDIADELNQWYAEYKKPKK